MWLFLLMQWSCISLCQNIDHLSIFHVSVKVDAMVIEFDSTKMKKRGDKLHPKHSYTKPPYYDLCIFTAMGVYFGLLNST